MSTRGIVPCQYTKKYCLWIKKKAKYCYLTFSITISFFSDIFSPKRLTAARAMLHWTRTKGKNRGIIFVFAVFRNIMVCKYTIQIQISLPDLKTIYRTLSLLLNTFRFVSPALSHDTIFWQRILCGSVALFDIRPIAYSHQS